MEAYDIRGQYAWSESGMALLQEIQIIIDDNGGYEKYFEIVHRESQENLYKTDTLKFRSDVLKMVNRIHSHDIPGILGISQSRYQAILKDLGLIGKLVRRKKKIRTNTFPTYL